jgi:catechol 2,3-dioxygenase-like lactoylglutathione lyase family enzyme
VEAIGPIDHVYYWTRDLDVAVAFYRDVLGLKLLRQEGSGWAEFDAGPIRFALHGTDGDQAPAGGTVVLRVEDLERARWALEQRGVEFDPHVGEVENVARFATLRDPDGNPVTLIEYRA